LRTVRRTRVGAIGVSQLMATPRPVDDLLGAVATTRHVIEALHRYDARDHAIEVLEDDVRIVRAIAEDDLRRLLRPLVRDALAALH
jgi:hypothetical protein